ncbi:hypothetical protein ACS0TY_027809 [Phlomoides rotata]
MVRGVRIDVNEHALEAGLFVLDMKDFDVILGMDCLSKYGADLMCHEMRAFLHTPIAKKTTLYGVKSRTIPRVVSAMKTMKMFRKYKYMGFLVNIVGSQKLEMSVADVLVVREYQDVFKKSFLEFHPIDKWSSP